MIFAGVIALFICVWLLGRFYPGNGLEQIGQRTARQITESREMLEADDLEQMLKAHNARRRARGRPEVTAEDVELQVAADRAEQSRRRDELLAERELDQLLEATNARRRARGLPERDRAEVEREFGGGRSGGSPAA